MAVLGCALALAAHSSDAALSYADILGRLNDLEYLATLSFILLIAVMVQLTELIMRRTSPLLYRILGIFLPLITTN